MKEIKREIENTQVKTIIEYEAMDGTVFSQREDCEKYEDTAAAVLLGRLRECEINRLDPPEWLDGCDENTYRILIPTTQEHLNTMNQLWFIYNGSGKEELNFTEKDLNTVIIMGVRHNERSLDWCWFYKLNEMIKEVVGDRHVNIEIL